MRRLLDDLLGLEAADEAVEAGRADVVQVLHALVDDLDLRRVSVELDLRPGEVAVDPVSLERIVENLLLNAAKFSPAGASVRLRSRTADGGTVVSVADQGPAWPSPTGTASSSRSSRWATAAVAWVSGCTSPGGSPSVTAVASPSARRPAAAPSSPCGSRRRGRRRRGPARTRRRRPRTGCAGSSVGTPDGRPHGAAAGPGVAPPCWSHRPGGAPVSANENVAARTPDLPVSLSDLAREVLQEARSSDSGNAALTLTPNESAAVKQTVIGVRAGGSVGPDRWNGPATVQVLSGRARIGGTDLAEGQWTVVEGQGTDVTADDDLALLLTVAPDA
jgi:hypothetical protein